MSNTATGALDTTSILSALALAEAFGRGDVDTMQVLASGTDEERSELVAGTMLLNSLLLTLLASEQRSTLGATAERLRLEVVAAFS